MIFEKDLRRARNAARSQGAYFRVSVSKVPDAREDDFLWVMLEDVDFDNPSFAGAEVEGLTRRLFTSESSSPAAVGPIAGGRVILETLFTSFGGSEVADLLPIPLRRALNFRFVAFIAASLFEESLPFFHNAGVQEERRVESKVEKGNMIFIVELRAVRTPRKLLHL